MTTTYPAHTDDPAVAAPPGDEVRLAVQLALAAEWDQVGRSHRPSPLLTALSSLGHTPASHAVEDVMRALVASGADVEPAQLVLASAHRPGRTWRGRVANCIHLLLGGMTTDE